MKTYIKRLRLLVAVLLDVSLLSTNTQAQWVQTNGPYGDNVASIAIDSMNLFAGTSDAGVFLSTDNGASRTAVNSGLTNTYVYALVDEHLHAGVHRVWWKAENRASGVYVIRLQAGTFVTTRKLMLMK